MNKISIYGGLGNQMFQYALNVALNESGSKSRISLSTFFYHNHHNGFNLGHAFALNLPFSLNVQNRVLQHLKSLYLNKVATFGLVRVIPRYQHLRYNKYLEPQEFVYDENVFNQHSKLIVGTWQSERYLKNIRDILLREFTFKEPGDEVNMQLIEEIKRTNAVSVHIRRGDFVSATWVNSHAVIKDEKYYLDGIKYLSGQLDKPHFYIFSDDMTWAKANIKLTNCTFVDHNRGNNSYVDMYLMSLCKHNIIANSTFSWWGAWLNRNENKIVIMPERWLNNIPTPGIFPDNWLRFKV
jgi:hypothetical protein